MLFPIWSITLNYLSQLEIFISAADLKSFTKASYVHHITRSAVGKVIAKLEEDVGTTLFIRNRKSIQLTESGVIFYQGCIQASNSMRVAESSIHSSTTTFFGKLKVTVPGALVYSSLSSFFVEFMKLHPDIQLEISFNDSVIDIINEGFDLAIRNSSDIVSTSIIEVERLYTHDLVFCASPEYLENKPPIISPEELSSEYATINYVNKGYNMKWNYISKGNDIYFPVNNARIQTDNMSFIVQTAIEGLGIAWLPTWLIKDNLENDQLIQLFPEHESRKISTFAIWPKSEITPPKTRLLVEFLKSRYEQM